jgi:dipeptidyl aminopeptidase/acylaminoacyl peptidase
LTVESPSAHALNVTREFFSSDRGNRASDRANGNDSDLWMMNLDGTGLQRVTNTPNRGESAPAWSPEGRWIAYGVGGTLHGKESAQLYVARPNGSLPRMITHPCRCKCTSQYKSPTDHRSGQPPG